MWPFFLSHHHSEDSERCVRLGSVHFCRRCIALWPICFVGVAYLIGQQQEPAAGTVIAGWLALPVLEFVAVHTGKLSYSPRRVWIFSTFAAFGSAHLFHRYLLDPSDHVVWMLALGFGIPAAAAALYHEMGKNPKVL